MAAVDTVFEQLGSMTVLELVELKKKIEDEWGITAAAAVAVAAPGVGGAAPAEAEEKRNQPVSAQQSASHSLPWGPLAANRLQEVRKKTSDP